VLLSNEITENRCEIKSLSYLVMVLKYLELKMKSSGSFIITVFFAVALSITASFGYVKYVEKKNPESYLLNPEQAISRTEIQNMIKEFIVENPALIVESVDRMNMEQARKEKDRTANFIKENLKEIQTNKDDPRIGNPDAKVKIVEFFDYRCGYCKKMMKVKDQLLASGNDVEIIFKEFPVLGDFSDKAAHAALAVNHIDKRKYMDYHRAMLTYNGPIDENTILNIVKSTGITEEQFNKALKDKSIEKILDDNRKLARNIGIMGSPAYLIGEDYYPGAVSYEEIIEIINRNSNSKNKNS
jgi:protein-disulfide isomerase